MNHSIPCPVDKSQPSRLLYIGKEEKHSTRTDRSFATIEWEMENTIEDTHLHARRQTDAIIVEGKRNGERFRKELHIDDAPWYQATSWSLRSFVLSSENKVRFWTVRADTLEPYRITASKKGSVALDLNPGEEEAVQVELRLTGMLAPFWKSRYWFCKADGVFLRFEGPSGPPGAPQMSIEYRGPSTPCELAPLEQLSGLAPKPGNGIG